MTDNIKAKLELGDNDGVWLTQKGNLQIWGSTPGRLGVQLIVYTPENAIQLLDFLKKHEDDIMIAAGCDPLDDANQIRW